VAESISQSIPGLPPCPYEVPPDAILADLHSIVHIRHGLQQWLSTVLLFPEARNSSAMQTFLTYASNMIPPQYDSVPWTVFTANGQVASSALAFDDIEDNTSNLDDLMMDDMFDGGDEIVVGPLQDDSEDEEEYRASERYALLDEPVTQEDEMDIANAIAGEFEMIDDVGSLAQSLGASHLGRSLLLQEEMTTPHDGHFNHHDQEQHQPRQTGLQIGKAISGSGSGGIGSAMEHASHQPPVSMLNRPTPEGPPRLDAFKMIKVIGKGSFGMFLLQTTIVNVNQSFLHSCILLTVQAKCSW
jgi:hypothetical protein